MVSITREIVATCGSILNMMEHKIRHTKSTVVVKYNNDYDLIVDHFMDTLPYDARMRAIKDYPCVIAT